MSGRRNGRRLEEVTGRRAETTEWGLRQTADGIFGRKGTVEPRVGEEHARQVVGRAGYGYRNTEVVKRTVVTYTTGWEAAPESTVPEPLDVMAALAGNTGCSFTTARLGAPGRVVQAPASMPAEDPQEVLF